MTSAAESVSPRSEQGILQAVHQETISAEPHEVFPVDPSPAHEADFFSQFFDAQNRTPPAPQAASFPTFDWPLDSALHKGVVAVTYPDDDASGAIADYEGMTHTFDGQIGTSLSLYSFREMDRGYPVLAAATGRVTAVVFDKADRNYQFPFPDDGNLVYVRHSGGTERSRYYKLRTNSTTVALGDTVQVGDTLGLVGSSGISGGAGLRFDVGEFTPSWVPRDPWNGSYNVLPSLWNSQEPYVGDDPLRVYELDMTTQAAAGGDVFTIPTLRWVERMTHPTVMGVGEPWLPVWMLLQGQSTDSYTLRVRRPDNSVYATATTTLGSKQSYNWHLWVFGWGSVPSSDYGTWSLEVESSSTIIKSSSFVVGASTGYGPRFYPLAGRSFRVTGVERRDTLRIQSLGGPVTYALVNAPSFVSLVNDSIVVIGSNSIMTRRFDFFQAVATDGSGKSDTMRYQLVDLTRPWKCFPDLDGDGWGDATSPGLPSHTDTDGVCLPGTVSLAFDCDDSNADISPNGNETCNGLDDNCNTVIDEDVLITYYRDADLDGYGTPTLTVQGCSPPAGYVANSSDCNDGNAAIHPGAIEVCNGIDEDCDSQVDDGVQTRYYRDADADGFGDSLTSQLACSPPSGYVTNRTDCNDANASIHPGTTEVCDGADNNCNGQTDEGVLTTYYLDADQDGYGHMFFAQQHCSQPTGFVTNNLDCNDINAAIHPGATEVCDGVDNNCSGQTDEGLLTTWYLDVDGDGYGDDATAGQYCSRPNEDYQLLGGDCKPFNYLIHPGATEICNNGEDDDCNSLVDDCPACLVVLTGDVNVDGTVTSSDIIKEVNYVFKSGALPLPCVAAGDADCSGSVTSSDIIRLVNYTFKGGLAPCDVCTIVPGSWNCP